MKEGRAGNKSKSLSLGKLTSWLRCYNPIDTLQCGVIIYSTFFHSQRCPSLYNNYLVTLPIVLSLEITTSNIFLMAFQILFWNIFDKNGIIMNMLASIRFEGSLARHCQHVSTSIKKSLLSFQCTI